MHAELNEACTDGYFPIVARCLSPRSIHTVKHGNTYERGMFDCRVGWSSTQASGPNCDVTSIRLVGGHVFQPGPIRSGAEIFGCGKPRVL